MPELVITSGLEKGSKYWGSPEFRTLLVMPYSPQAPVGMQGTTLEQIARAFGLGLDDEGRALSAIVVSENCIPELLDTLFSCNTKHIRLDIVLQLESASWKDVMALLWEHEFLIQHTNFYWRGETIASPGGLESDNESIS